MRNLKVLAVVGLAVALAAALALPALAASRTNVNVTGTPQEGTLEVQADKATVDVNTKGKDIKAIVDEIVKGLKAQGVTAGVISDSSFFVEADVIKLGEKDKELRPITSGNPVVVLGLTFTIPPTPTLSQWGLIALGVLLAGSMGFVLYRRRPSARPAVP